LVITRKAGERIMVGDDIVLQVLEISGGAVRIGIDAPRSTPIYREEIWRAVRRERDDRAGSPAPAADPRAPAADPRTPAADPRAPAAEFPATADGYRPA